MLDFFSLSQVPTCVHPAPKRHHVTEKVVEEEEKSDKGTATTFSHTSACRGAIRVGVAPAERREREKG